MRVDVPELTLLPRRLYGSYCICGIIPELNRNTMCGPSQIIRAAEKLADVRRSRVNVVRRISFCELVVETENLMRHRREVPSGDLWVASASGIGGGVVNPQLHASLV